MPYQLDIINENAITELDLELGKNELAIDATIDNSKESYDLIMTSLDIEVIRSGINLENYYTKSETDTLVSNAIAGLGQPLKKVIGPRPVSNIDANTIYIESNGSGGYTYWMYINNSWQQINSNDVDLSGYVTLEALSTYYQPDWNESDSSQPGYIKNKPTINPSGGQNDFFDLDEDTGAVYLKPQYTGFYTLGYIVAGGLPSGTTSGLTNVLTGVVTDNLQDGDILLYNGTDSLWNNVPLTNLLSDYVAASDVKTLTVRTNNDLSGTTQYTYSPIGSEDIEISLTKSTIGIYNLELAYFIEDLESTIVDGDPIINSAYKHPGIILRNSSDEFLVSVTYSSGQSDEDDVYVWKKISSASGGVSPSSNIILRYLQAGSYITLTGYNSQTSVSTSVNNDNNVIDVWSVDRVSIGLMGSAQDAITKVTSALTSSDYPSSSSSSLITLGYLSSALSTKQDVLTINNNITSGGTNLVPSGAIYSYLATNYLQASALESALSSYVTLSTSQTITGEKTFSNVTNFNNTIRFGNANNSFISVKDTSSNLITILSRESAANDLYIGYATYRQSGYNLGLMGYNVWIFGGSGLAINADASGGVSICTDSSAKNITLGNYSNSNTSTSINSPTINIGTVTSGTYTYIKSPNVEIPGTNIKIGGANGYIAVTNVVNLNVNTILTGTNKLYFNSTSGPSLQYDSTNSCVKLSGNLFVTGWVMAGETYGNQN